ncbi:MAG: hypothetical protein ACI808_000256 [Paraglaciecola sp.]|jgi:hypothetical protein
MLMWVKNIADFSDNTYGQRRIQKALHALGFPVSRRKIAQLMKEANVWVRYKKKYKSTTNSEHNKPIYNNELEQNFDVEQPIWLGCRILPIYGLQRDGFIWQSSSTYTPEKSWVGAWEQE